MRLPEGVKANASQLSLFSLHMLYPPILLSAPMLAPLDVFHNMSTEKQGPV